MKKWNNPRLKQIQESQAENLHCNNMTVKVIIVSANEVSNCGYKITINVKQETMCFKIGEV